MTDSHPDLSDSDLFVYFIQCGGSDGPIKIGVTKNVAKRLRALQHANPYPLSVLSMTTGGFEREVELHLVFRSDRIRGEWYRPSAALLRFIATGTYPAHPPVHRWQRESARLLELKRRAIREFERQLRPNQRLLRTCAAEVCVNPDHYFIRVITDDEEP